MQPCLELGADAGSLPGEVGRFRASCHSQGACLAALEAERAACPVEGASVGGVRRHVDEQIAAPVVNGRQLAERSFRAFQVVHECRLPAETRPRHRPPLVGAGWDCDRDGERRPPPKSPPSREPLRGNHVRAEVLPIGDLVERGVRRERGAARPSFVGLAREPGRSRRQGHRVAVVLRDEGLRRTTGLRRGLRPAPACHAAQHQRGDSGHGRSTDRQAARGCDQPGPPVGTAGGAARRKRVTVAARKASAS
jgi:hypothetical protein